MGVPWLWNCARHIEIEGDEEIDANAASRADEEVDAVVRIRRDVRLHAADLRLELPRRALLRTAVRDPRRSARRIKLGDARCGGLVRSRITS